MRSAEGQHILFNTLIACQIFIRWSYLWYIINNMIRVYVMVFQTTSDGMVKDVSYLYYMLEGWGVPCGLLLLI